MPDVPPCAIFKARLLVCTGLPVQPHCMYEMPDGSPGQAVWVDIPEGIHHALGAGNAFLSGNTFRSEFGLEVDEEAETVPGAEVGLGAGELSSRAAVGRSSRVDIEFLMTAECYVGGGSG